MNSEFKNQGISLWRTIDLYGLSVCEELSLDDKLVFGDAYWKELDTAYWVIKTCGFDDLTCIIFADTIRIEYYADSVPFGAEYLVGNLGEVKFVYFDIGNFYSGKPDSELIRNQFCKCEAVERAIKKALESNGIKNGE